MLLLASACLISASNRKYPVRQSGQKTPVASLCEWKNGRAERLNYISTTLRSRNVDALSKAFRATATCPTTTSTSHPPCSIYRQNHQWSNSWYSWRARYWDDRSQDAAPVGWSCGTHVRWPNPKIVVVWRAYNRDENCTPPTSALEGLAQRHFETIKHLYNAMARHRNWS